KFALTAFCMPVTPCHTAKTHKSETFGIGYSTIVGIYLCEVFSPCNFPCKPGNHFGARRDTYINIWKRLVMPLSIHRSGVIQWFVLCEVLVINMVGNPVI